MCTWPVFDEGSIKARDDPSADRVTDVTMVMAVWVSGIVGFEAADVLARVGSRVIAVLGVLRIERSVVGHGAASGVRAVKVEGLGRYAGHRARPGSLGVVPPLDRA